MADKLKLLQKLKFEGDYYRALLVHPETPRISRWLLGTAIAYLISPIDLIPDFIPVIGHLDDLLIVPALLFLACSFIPAEVKKECRDINKLNQS